MAELVALDLAKLHASIHHDQADDLLEVYLVQAHEIVVGRILDSMPADDSRRGTVEAWTAMTAPAQIKAAILHQFAELERFRGDDEPSAAPKWEDGRLSASVERLIKRFVDPPLA
jgi:hypothetical protein